MFPMRGRGGRGRGRASSYNITNKPTREQESTTSKTIIKPSSSQNLVKDEYLHSDVISINLALDLQTEAWFTNLRNTWSKLKKCPAVTNMIHQHFEICINPYEQALRLMYNSLDFKHSKPKSLSCLIMEEFKVWSDASRNKIIHLLTQPLKITAFNVVRQQTMFSLMKLVSEVYELAKDCDLFLGIIKYMLKEKKYKEACQSVALLGLHNKFNIDDFLVPLILQDKLSCAEGFLMDSPNHQTELVIFLDSMLGQPVSVRNALEPYIIKHQIPEVKYNKLQYKPWRKLVTRLVKLFHLQEDVTPFLNKRRNEGALQFLLYKKYVDNSFGEESWREMVQEAVKEEFRLQQELIAQVALYGDIEEALRWAHFYSIPKEYWPFSVRMLNDNPDAYERQKCYNNTQEKENWDLQNTSSCTNEYHSLKLSADVIHLIDSISTFEDFLDNGLQDINIVGIDCEWKPSFGVHSNELALMQIASRKAVYVIDTIALGSKVPHLWQELGKFLFSNCDILKLGFCFVSDISMIKHSLPHLSFNVKQDGFLDLLSLWKHIDKIPKVVFPHEVQSGSLSLSTLVHKCLGRPLDKSDQFSNWEKRPLRQSQIMYAALDAYCLIEVYDVMKNCCESAGVCFEEIFYNLMTNSISVHKKKSKKHLNKKRNETTAIKQPPSPHTENISVDSVKMVCDTMLQGLGKSLRRCGIDTVILENHNEHMECVRHYINDGRYILTRGAAFEKLVGNVPPGYCLRITDDDLDKQLKQVLEYYKIIVRKDDVFNVCQVCNGKSFVKINGSTMNAIASSAQQFRTYKPLEDYDLDDLEDEATGFSSEDDYDYDPIVRDLCTLKNSSDYHSHLVDVENCMTSKGKRIQVESIPEGVLMKNDVFYVCELCGKVYWDGSHLDKVLAGRLQGIVQE